MFPLTGNFLDLPEVKRGMSSRESRFVETIKIYDPGSYPPEMLTNKLEIWIGKVETRFFDIVDFADTLQSRDGITEEEGRKIDDWVKKAREKFMKFNLEINAKCNKIDGCMFTEVKAHNDTENGAKSLVGTEIIGNIELERGSMKDSVEFSEFSCSVDGADSPDSSPVSKSASESSFCFETVVSFDEYTPKLTMDVSNRISQLGFTSMAEESLIKTAVWLKESTRVDTVVQVAFVSCPWSKFIYDRGKTGVLNVVDQKPSNAMDPVSVSLATETNDANFATGAISHYQTYLKIHV